VSSEKKNESPETQAYGGLKPLAALAMSNVVNPSNASGS
jgi:hypothetical protein